MSMSLRPSALAFLAFSASAHIASSAPAPRQISRWSFPPSSPEDLKKAEASTAAALEKAKTKSANSAPHYASACTANLTASLPACLQYEPDWCWATAVSEIGTFFNPSHNTGLGNDCHGLECRIVSHMLDPFATGTCCKSRTPTGQCGTAWGSNQAMVKGIKFISGQDYIGLFGGPLPQAFLDDVLSMGFPVAMGVYWSNGVGGHMLTLGGCAGEGKYYLHDPLTKKGEYVRLSYEEVVRYNPGNSEDGATYEVVANMEADAKGNPVLAQAAKREVYGYWVSSFVLATPDTMKMAEFLREHGHTIFLNDVVTIAPAKENEKQEPSSLAAASSRRHKRTALRAAAAQDADSLSFIQNEAPRVKPAAAAANGEDEDEEENMEL